MHIQVYILFITIFARDTANKRLEMLLIQYNVKYIYYTENMNS